MACIFDRRVDFSHPKEIAGFTAFDTQEEAAGSTQVETADAEVLKNSKLEAWLKARGGAGTHHTRMTYVRVECATGLTWCRRSPTPVHVQHAEEWLASVHTLGMPKPVITCVLKVLRNGLLLYLPLHVPKPVCVQSASQKRVSKPFQNRNNDGWLP